MYGVFSKHKDIFGEPRKGVHRHRFLNTAIVDYLATIVLAILITYATNIPLVITTIILLVLSIVLHYLFGVETTIVKAIRNID